MASSTGAKLSREEYKRRQELENARKAGTAAPALDIEGNMINPHIPQYIAQAPWYLNQGHPGLQHQKFKKEKPSLDLNVWYERGVKTGPPPVRFRKGACENCGAMTHNKKECTERPRKLGAKWTNEDLQEDEVVIDLKNLNYAAKRDAWNGYDASDYQKVLKEFEKLEELRLKMKEEKVKSEMTNEREDELKGYAESAPMPGQQFDAKKRITVRNLRIREHTAKFLLNHDVNSAYYDPKTRSMRGNPFAGKEGGDPNYVTENFMRTTGESLEVLQTQVYAWNAKESEHLSLQANPTKTEIMRKAYLKEAEIQSSATKEDILARYGGQEHLETPPMELLLGQTEQYVEYDRSGRVIKGVEKVVPKSHYPEDIHHKNHREIWGSYWEEGCWGYACCHSTVYNSYCLGQIGIRSKSNEVNFKKSELEAKNAQAKKSLLEEHREKMEFTKSKKANKREKTFNEDFSREVKNVLKKSRKENAKEEVDRGEFSSWTHLSEPTEAEKEAYLLSKKRSEDPLANYVER
ncbi:uncharacterized protein LOC135144514 isoform X2 [Zophobas morio]|uniref:uncharacterized protein LOC135144514 isoform X2 n=2 Tax=Zophobas morio TaxID=2755281 RepID=UPI003082D5A3